MSYFRRASFVRETVVATAAVVCLYVLAQGVGFQPFQIPGYLIIVGFDVLEGIFGSAGTDYGVLFAAYLLGLGLIGATVVHALRRWEPISGPNWRLGAAGAFAVVGALSLLFALGVLLGSSQWDAVFIAGTAGLVLLGIAGWLAGFLGNESTVSG